MTRVTAESALRIHLRRTDARHVYRALIRALLQARRAARIPVGIAVHLEIETIIL